jgi:hypothetical protein
MAYQGTKLAKQVPRLIKSRFWATPSDIQATAQVHASIIRLAKPTTFAQFAAAYTDIRSVDLCKEVSDGVKAEANRAMTQATTQGAVLFAPSVTRSWPKKRRRGALFGYADAEEQGPSAVCLETQYRFMVCPKLSVRVVLPPPQEG